MDLLTIADQNQQLAFNLLQETQLIEAWQKIGATIHIVGSLKSGLMMKNLDIDLHIYTEKLQVAESFSVMQELAERLCLTDIQYKNLIDTEEECIEWHASHKDKEMNVWKFDMIHIRKGSKYDGVVERVTDAVASKLTPELRRIILQIKFDVPRGTIIPGIEIYRAVFTGKVKSYAELEQWRNSHPLTNSLDWMP